MPRTIIEAMMMGKPVVATNIRGCRELVISGETGILVKYKNSFELMQAINYLIINPEVRKEMGLKARVNAHIFYKEKNIIKKQIDKIQELLCQDA
jgi:glycosyltransferase involved in cell wall biosynthesis